jgi:hypothetical protein
MTASTLLDTLSRQGISVRVCEDGSLGVKPRSKLTDELLTTLRHHKPAIIAALTSPTKESHTGNGTTLTCVSEQQDLWQPRGVSEVCEKCQDPECWLSPIGRWCLLIPADQEKIRATKTKKPTKPTPAMPPPWKAPDEVEAAYWTRQCNDVLTAWQQKDWGPCPECGQEAWYSYEGFSLCGICTPQQDCRKTVH